jgi:hypothetical protein
MKQLPRDYYLKNYPVPVPVPVPVVPPIPVTIPSSKLPKVLLGDTLPVYHLVTITESFSLIDRCSA